MAALAYKAIHVAFGLHPSGSVAVVCGMLSGYVYFELLHYCLHHAKIGSYAIPHVNLR